MKWLGVAVSGIFLAVSLVSAPWSLGLSSPLLISALTGAAIQGAGMTLQVTANLVEDPTLQMAAMMGGMVLGIAGGLMTSRASAMASPLIKQLKGAGALKLASSSSQGASAGVPTIPRAVFRRPMGTQGLRNVTGVTGATSGPQTLPSNFSQRMLPAGKHYLPVRPKLGRPPITVPAGPGDSWTLSLLSSRYVKKFVPTFRATGWNQRAVEAALGANRFPR